VSFADFLGSTSRPEEKIRKKQRALIKQMLGEFCPRLRPGATVVYIGDAESKFPASRSGYLKGLGVVIVPSAKMPDVVVHDTKRKLVCAGRSRREAQERWMERGMN